MSTITPAEKALLETKPQATKLWLSVYQPNTALVATVNDATIDRGDRTIAYTLVSGSHELVESGMTMLVGSTPGSDDKGKIRIRSASDTEIIVAENADIDWADGDHLTVLNFFEIVSIYPRIIQDPADDENTLWYKDYDIEYTNQNSVLGSFICMGPHHAAFIDDGDVDIYYSASGTYNLKDESMSFEWWFQGADTTGSSQHTPGLITYSTPGHYTTRLTVTTSGTASDTSYRHVSIYDRPGQGNNTPILKWNTEELSGDRDQGGWMGSIVIRDSISKEVVRDGALVVIFQESWYGGTKDQIGGNAIQRSEILFTGYILDGTIQYNYEDKFVEFEVGSATYVMQSLDCPAISITSSANPASQANSDENYPSAWALVLDLDVKRAIYHYYRWHSTVLLCNDFEYVGDDFEMRHFESDRASLYDAISTLVKEALVGSLIADRQGKLWTEIDASAIEDVNNTLETSDLLIDKDNWIGEPSISEVTIPTTSYLEMGGIVYDGPVLETYSALLSEAPGNVPGRRGGYQKGNARLALNDQAQLNTLCGNVFASLNNRYPRSEYRLAGHYLNFDIAPQELLEITMAAGDTPRGITFDSEKFTIRQMTLIYDSQKQTLLPIVSVRKTTQGMDAATVEIPDVPPVDPPDGGGGGGEVVVPPLPAPVWPPTFGSMEVALGRFRTLTIAAGGVVQPLYIRTGNYYTNSSSLGFYGVGIIDGDKVYVKSSTEGSYLVSIHVYARKDSPFTLQVDYLPCPGMIMSANWYNLVWPSTADDKSHAAIESLAIEDGQYFASLSINLMAMADTWGLGENATRMMQTWVSTDVVGVRIGGSFSVMKLAAWSVNSLCVYTAPPGG